MPFTDQKAPNDIFNYSGIAENTNIGYGTYDTFENLVIKIRNQNRIESTDSTFLEHYNLINIIQIHQEELKEHLKRNLSIVIPLP